MINNGLRTLVGADDQTDIMDALELEQGKFIDYFEKNFLSRINIPQNEKKLLEELNKVSIIVRGADLDIRSHEYLPHIRNLNLGIAEVEGDDSLSKQERIKSMLLVCDLFLIAIGQKKKLKFPAAPQQISSILDRQPQ